MSDTSEALEDEDHVPTTEQDYPEDLTQIIARFVQRVLDPEMIVTKVTVARFVQRVLDPKMIAIAMQADAGERPALLSHLVSHWYDGIDFRYPPDRYPCSLWSELLRPAICVAQFEHAAEQLYPEMFKYFGGIDAFIWKARQHAPAFYNENGTATYHVNQDHMATCMKDLDNAFLVCTDVTPIVGPTFWYDRAGFRRLLWCCGCEEPESSLTSTFANVLSLTGALTHAPCGGQKTLVNAAAYAQWFTSSFSGVARSLTSHGVTLGASWGILTISPLSCDCQRELSRWTTNPQPCGPIWCGDCSCGAGPRAPSTISSPLVV